MTPQTSRNRDTRSRRRNSKTVAAAVASGNGVPPKGEPDRLEVAGMAYQLWLERGCRQGRDLEDWYDAVEMVRRRAGQ